MYIIKIEQYPNGAHRNQQWTGGALPVGYAELPASVGVPETLENFPFGDIEVDYTGAYPVVTAWHPLPMPEPSEPDITPAEQRENAYNTETIIPWGGDMLTVTAAAQLWQYYAAEGSYKADELQALIAAAKAEIRAKYPDEEVTV